MNRAKRFAAPQQIGVAVMKDQNPGGRAGLMGVEIGQGHGQSAEAGDVIEQRRADGNLAGDVNHR